MDTPEAEPEQGAASKPTLRWGLRVGSWLLIGAAVVVALGLAAISLGPRVLSYQALVVRSGSMAPAIPTGSVVFYSKRTAQNVKVGNVIVFNRPGMANERVTHRVYRIGNGPQGRYFVTKGDANGAPDDWRVPAVGSGWVAAFHVPVVGYVLGDLQSGLARLLLLLIPAALLALITLYEIVQDRKRGARA